MLESALLYLRMGLSIIPAHTVLHDGSCSCGRPGCSAAGKHPRIAWQEYTKRKATEAEVREWWTKWPDSNIACCTGKVSDLTVLDIDGDAGYQALEMAGIPYETMPVTPVVRTGKGRHVYCAYFPDVKSVVGVLPQVDVRNDGGIVILPPSVHVSGRKYEWEDGLELGEVALAVMPFWDRLLQVSGKQKDNKGIDLRSGAAHWADSMLEGIAEGGRNMKMAQLAGRYYSRGLSPREVEFILRAVNAKNNPPLPEDELMTIAGSIYNSDQKERMARLLDSNAYEDNTEARQASLVTLKEAFAGLEVLGMRRITGETSQYFIEFDKGTVVLAEDQLWNSRQLQRRVSEVTKVVIPEFSAKTIPMRSVMLQAILNLVEDVDAGDEATLFGELALMLTEYLMTASLFAGEGTPPPRGAFFRADRVWVSTTEFSRWAANNWGSKPTIPALAQKLKAWGAESKEWHCEGRTRKMWGIPLDRLGPDVQKAVTSSDEEAEVTRA